MPLVTVKMADAKGDAAINKIENASYFTEGEYRLTNINDELAYTSPIEMDGFLKAGKAEYTPGYNLISAVSTDKGASTVKGKMMYAPSQYLEHDLERTIRKAYPNKIIHDSYLEPNERWKALLRSFSRTLFEIPQRSRGGRGGIGESGNGGHEILSKRKRT
ncbi:hypothetical protein RCO48_20690 [Peribacillus frigoritolerans]|nr:hypothetical protein [Peribacillus frigoritolerans]